MRIGHDVPECAVTMTEIRNAGRQFFGKGIVGGIFQFTIRRNRLSMRPPSHDSNPPLEKEKATLR